MSLATAGGADRKYSDTFGAGGDFVERKLDFRDELLLKRQQETAN
ncbi:MAG: hypothetical protein ACOY5V_18510 [Pseudomonadota bacterium]